MFLMFFIKIYFYDHNIDYVNLSKFSWIILFIELFIELNKYFIREFKLICIYL